MSNYKIFKCLSDRHRMPIPSYPCRYRHLNSKVIHSRSSKYRSNMLEFTLENLYSNFFFNIKSGQCLGRGKLDGRSELLKFYNASNKFKLLNISDNIKQALFFPLFSLLILFDIFVKTYFGHYKLMITTYS